MDKFFTMNEINFNKLISFMRHLFEMRWAKPFSYVELYQIDGKKTIWLAKDFVLKRISNVNKSSRFMAVCLPEVMILSRKINIPILSEIDANAAIETEVAAISPFALDDLIFGFTYDQGFNGSKNVLIALASRNHINQYIGTMANLFPNIRQPEVWAVFEAGQAVIFRGFGEIQRKRSEIRMWRLNITLLLFAVLLLALIIVTPILQLRFRAIEALNSYATLQTVVAPVVKNRAEYLSAVEKYNHIKDATSAAVDGLWVTDRVTQLLKDDSFISAMQVIGDKVTISGITGNAAALMQHLGSQPGVRDVKAIGASTRALGAAKDSFSVELTLYNMPGRVEKKSAPEVVAQLPTQMVSRPTSASSGTQMGTDFLVKRAGQ